MTHQETTTHTMSHLWCIIMAGGLGSRFWPVAGVESPKQFTDVMGTGRTMLQTTFSRMERAVPREHIVIVTGEQYVGTVHGEIDGLEDWQVLGEPLRRNTAPCIAYAAAVVRERDPEAIVVVTPADHAIFHEERFVADIEQAVDTVRRHDWIITLGAQPTRPDTSYGYIQFRDTSSLPESGVRNLHPVVTFTEKPPVEMARQMIASGEFFWNTGLLVWTMPTLLEAYRRHLPELADALFRLSSNTSPEDLEYVYSRCESVSVDNGIMEKADNVHVMEASFGWSDVETWDSLYGISPHDAKGNAVISGNVFTYDTRNTLVALPTDPTKTVVLEGLDGYIVAASGDTLLVCRRQSEELIFKFANDVELKKLIDKK